MPDAPRRPYFVNAFVDTAFIGGISIATCGILWALQARGTPDPVPTLAFWLGWVCNWPHFSASSWRLYHTRANIAQYPVTALGVPVLILAAIAGAFLSPGVAAPALVKLYLLWSPFHFSGQSFGITMLYARRADVSLSRMSRAVFAGFFYATYASVILIQETDKSTVYFGAIPYPSLGLPAWLATACDAAVAVYGVLLLAVFAGASISSRKLLPPILLLPALAQLTWFVVARHLPSFNALVPFFHAMQYLLIAWAMQLRERAAATDKTPAPSFVRWETLKWALLNFLGGLILFGALPRLIAMTGPPLMFVQPVLFAAIQIHHFFVDGVIWKLRNPRVGAALTAAIGEGRA